ncbi:MAG: hypothetical protein WC586_00290 [Methanoregula sp.]
MRLRPIPPILANIVHSAIQVCNGTHYFSRGACRSCGGVLSGYDTRSKRFAVICDDDREHTVEVFIHRAYCRSCGRILVPEGPFYPGIRTGSPVVDLCRALSTTMSYGRVSARLAHMGVKVDRWSVRAYCQSPYIPPPTVAAFGMDIPLSIISLSALAGSPGTAGCAQGDDVLFACYLPPGN